MVFRENLQTGMKEAIVSAVRLEFSLCSDIEPLIDFAIDNQLDVDTRARFDQHMGRCVVCAERFSKAKRIKNALADARVDVDPPPEFFLALESTLKKTLAADHRKFRNDRLVAMISIAASVIAVVLMVASLSQSVTQNRALERRQALLKKAIEHHALDVPADVATTDAKRMHAFLNARVKNVVVPTLATQGFALQGARVVDVLDERTAQLTYASSLGERITLTAFPSEKPVADALEVHNANLNARMFVVDDQVMAVVGEVSPTRLKSLVESVER